MRRAAFLAAALAASAAAPAAADARAELAAEAGAHWGLLEEHCVACHNGVDWAGGVAFDIMSPDAIPEDAEVWEAALQKLRGRLMPPPGEPQPEQSEIDGFVGWLEASIDASAPEHATGYVPIQRLNRTEYAIAVKGLLDVDIDPESVLPTDIEVDGFDNIAHALGTSPSFLEQYLGAARRVARLAVGDPATKTASVTFVSPGGAQATHADGMPLGTRGDVVFPHVFPADGDYTVSILDLDIGLYPRAAESQQTLLLLIDGEEVFQADVGGEHDLEWVDHDGVGARVGIMERFADIPITMTAGRHEIAIAFVERSRVLSDDPVGPAMLGNFGAGLGRLAHVIGNIELYGPIDSPGISMSSSRRLLYVCQPASATEERPCAEAIVANLARRAFRRPVTGEDVAALMPFYEAGRAQGGNFDAGIEQAVTAVLVSPDFLYRAVLPPEGAGSTYPLSDVELASRLSFFLWSQGPDEALLAAAEAGALSDPAAMEAQVRRMLADPRAQALVTSFALKWLNLDGLDEVDPNGREFPGFSDALRDDFSTEVVQFMSSIFFEDRSVVELLSADHSFLNEALAQQYDVPGIRGDQFRRVTMTDPNRWGLLGKAAVLLRTSYGDRTSPVLRGAWIMDKLLGTPPTPPPPNVETDLSIKPGETPVTMRARLEQHRADESCNACHGVIDPWGLALENYDVTGRWRDVDVAADAPIDARTVLSSGMAVEGPAQLRQALVGRPDQFVQNMTAKLMMYALGRELEHTDMPTVRAIVRDAAEDDYTLASLVLGIVESDAFRMQANPELAQLDAPRQTNVH
jgi:mono/diheme cytochrome c family protein